VTSETAYGEVQTNGDIRILFQYLRNFKPGDKVKVLVVPGERPCPNSRSNKFGGHLPGCYGPDDPRHTGVPWDGFNIYGTPYRLAEGTK